MRLGFVVAALCAGCLKSSSVHCGDYVCGSDSVCVPDGCARQDEIAACVGLADADMCTTPSGGVGSCQNGVCRTGLCGNGAVDLGEVCDDGNRESGDGCRGDCSKFETCDGILDIGEPCDDGNTNAADGCDACVQTKWTPTVIVGGLASAATLGVGFRDVAVDANGNLYVADFNGHRVHRIDRGTNVVTPVAGVGSPGFGGDDGPATSAMLDGPTGIAVDGLGNVYIADTGNHRVRRVDAETGSIVTIAGTGVGDFGGDGGPATGADLNYPYRVTVDGLGNVFIADTYNNRVRKVDADTGVMSTVAGGGTSLGDDGPATAAQLTEVYDITLDSAGNLYIADASWGRVRRVLATTGTITTVAGDGNYGDTGDGGPATSARLRYPVSVEVDALGNLYVGDGDTPRIRRVDAMTGVITAFAGSGQSGLAGDGGPATSASMTYPFGIAIREGDVYIADTANRRIRTVNNVGTITTVAGTFADAADGGSATSAALVGDPLHVAADAMGNLYISDALGSRLRRVDAMTGAISTVAGTGSYGISGDDGPAANAPLYNAGSVVLDATGNLYLSTWNNSNQPSIRRVDALTGVITTIVSSGLGTAMAMASDAQGNLYLADSYFHVVRRVDALTRAITVHAGTGVAGFSGDDGDADLAQLNNPTGVRIDAAGNLLIADAGNFRIRKVVGGIITTVAGNGGSGSTGDGGAATSAAIGAASVAVDNDGTLYLYRAGTGRIRKVEAGTITAFAGTGTAGFAGDGGPALAGALEATDVTVDGQGNVYVAGTYYPDASDRISYVRRIEATSGRITTIAGQIAPGGMGRGANKHLADPRALALGTSGAFIAGGGTGTVQRLHSSGALAVVAGRHRQLVPTASLALYRDQSFGSIGGIALDETAGRFYITEGNSIHAVTMVDPDDETTWTIAPLANAAGTAGFTEGAGISAIAAQFRQPTGLYLDETSQMLYVADTGNHVIRTINLATGMVQTIAGVPATRGFVGDGQLATAALLQSPQAITRCSSGDLFIADTKNHRVRRIASGSNVISTVLGDGTAGSSGEGGPSSNFPIHAPQGLGCDATGNLYVTSTSTVRVVLAAASGVVDGTGEVQTVYGSRHSSSFPESVTTCLTGLVVVDATTLRVADACTGLLVEVRREAL